MSVGTVHRGEGFVELNAMPAFPASWRGDPAATRRHRLAMTDPGHAFLWLEFDGQATALRPTSSPGEPPRWAGDRISVAVEPGPDTGTMRQQWRVGTGGEVHVVRIRLRGSLDRPALAEITELEPPAATGAVTRFHVDSQTVRIEAAGLGATAEVRAEGTTVRWRLTGDGAMGDVILPAEGAVELTLVVRLATVARATDYHAAPVRGGDALTAAALAYVRGCTALAVDEGERVILTDHRILPLSWTRDAYWQALALLAADEPGDRERVADHLRWLWRRCERPDARWARSHHADGRRKDVAFQADQQLYPLVELADFWRWTGSLPAGVDWSTAVARVWDAFTATVDPRLGLVPSAENAADDPAVAPFIGSSQILLWYAARRVAELADAGALALDARKLCDAAVRTGDAFHRRIAGDPAAGWAYAVDASGRRVDYHDANDLPVALAPVWGFCDATDAGWRRTMELAFSPANPAWAAGRFAGLGSVHTAGAWTLGDVQAWIRARCTADAAGMNAAIERLARVAMPDGMLPEAYDTESLAPVRHWFAWPGAALAALRLLDDGGRLDRIGVAPSR